MQGKKITIYQITFIAMMSALMCILGPIAVPIGPVPLSLTNMAIIFTVSVLGMKAGTISYLIYLLLGAVGLPVFSGYAGGLGKLVGPTGGYLLGFIFMAILGGFIMEISERKRIPTILGFGIGMVIDYIFGTLWFVYITQSTVSYALTVCVIPFLIGDVIKLCLGVLLGKEVRKGLSKANLQA